MRILPSLCELLSSWASVQIPSPVRGQSPLCTQHCVFNGFSALSAWGPACSKSRSQAWGSPLSTVSSVRWAGGSPFQESLDPLPWDLTQGHESQSTPHLLSDSGAWALCGS